VEIERARLRREGSDYVAGLIVTSRAGEASERRLETAVRDNLARALELHRQGQLHPAEAAYLPGPRADENNVEAVHGLGTMRYQQGWVLAAQNLLRRAVEVDPTHAEAHVSMGHIERQLGSVANAARAYRKALELRPDHAVAAQSLAPVLEEVARLE